MKKIIITIMVFSLSLSANKLNTDGCTETRLGASNSYIVKCDNDKYRVTYDSGFKHNIIEFVELGNVKKEKSSKKVEKEKERTSTSW